MNRKYEEEFKKTIVELYENGKSVSELTREYGLKDKKLIYTWIKKYSKIETQSKNSKITTTMKDYQNLQKINKQLEEENIILKKAVAIFTKP